MKMAQEVANEIMGDLHCSQNCCGVIFECHFVSPNVSWYTDNQKALRLQLSVQLMINEAWLYLQTKIISSFSMVYTCTLPSSHSYVMVFQPYRWEAIPMMTTHLLIGLAISFVEVDNQTWPSVTLGPCPGCHRLSCQNACMHHQVSLVVTLHPLMLFPTLISIYKQTPI